MRHSKRWRGIEEGGKEEEEEVLVAELNIRNAVREVRNSSKYLPDRFGTKFLGQKTLTATT